MILLRNHLEINDRIELAEDRFKRSGNDAVMMLSGGFSWQRPFADEFHRAIIASVEESGVTRHKY